MANVLADFADHKLLISHFWLRRAKSDGSRKRRHFRLYGEVLKSKPESLLSESLKDATAMWLLQLVRHNRPA